MAKYALSVEAEADLYAIALYTMCKWGPDQLRRYEESLEKHFRSLASGDVRSRAVFDHRNDIFVSRCEHHYVFHVMQPDVEPLVLAVFHENMNLMTRLRERLNQ